MATMKNIVEGLEILMKYDPDGGVCSEYDILYAAPDVGEDDLSPEDEKRMDELGWHWDGQADSWACFV